MKFDIFLAKAIFTIGMNPILPVPYYTYNSYSLYTSTSSSRNKDFTLGIGWLKWGLYLGISWRN